MKYLLHKLHLYKWSVIICWSLLVFASSVFDVMRLNQGAREMGMHQLRTAIETDLVFRGWELMHGDAYVSGTNQTPPNRDQDLAHMDQRHITKLPGAKQTLLNPVYIHNQLSEIDQKNTPKRTHITSLNLLCPDNVPDEWEREALGAFRKGQPEVTSIEENDGQQVLRYMRPLYAEEGCLQCHGDQDYEVGDIMGGVSLSMSMEPLRATAQEASISNVTVHSLIWLIVIFGVQMVSLQIKTRIIQQEQSEEALRDSEDKFRNLVETSHDLIFKCDNKGNIVYLNPAWEQTHGYKLEEMLGHSYTEFVAPDILEHTKQEFSRLISGGDVVDFETAHISKSGQRIDMLFNVIPLRDAGGEIIGTQGTARDVTRDKRAEEALRKSEEFLADTSRIAKSGGWEVDLATMQGRFTHETCNIYGQPLTKMPSLEESINYFAPEAQPIVREAIQEAINNGTSYDLELPFINAKGEHIWVRTIGKVDFVDNKAVRLYGFIQDITERKQSEEQIKEQAKFLENMFDSLTHPFAVIDVKDYSILKSNSAYDGTIARLGDTCYAYTHQSDKPCDELDHPCPIKEILRTKKSMQVEHVHFDKQGNARTMEVYAYPIFNVKGDVVQMIEYCLDITERKKTEEALRVAERQLARKERLESIGNLASGIAHDLNNLLTPITMAVGSLKTKLTDPEDQWMISALETSAWRGADVVKQILSFARGSDTLLKPLDLRKVLDGVIDMARHTLPKNIKLKVSELKEFVVNGNATQLHQVFLNLIINSKDAMPGGGTITIQVEESNWPTSKLFPIPEKPGQYIKISVSDTGKGMSPEVQDKVFDPFFTTKEPGTGTGLGLAVAYNIIKTHQGYMTVRSEIGKGTQFNIFIPSEVAAEEAAAPIEADDINGHGEVVLVVDDEEEIINAVIAILSAKNYQILSASNGVEALDLLEHQRDRIDIILTDILMPEMGGIELIQQAKDIKPSLKVIAMSGLETMSSLNEKLGDYGVDKHLSKPFVLKDLLHALHDV